MSPNQEKPSDPSLVWDFLKLLIAAVALHVFCAVLFDYLLDPPTDAKRWAIPVLILLVAVVSTNLASHSKRYTHKWAWLVFFGYICLQVASNCVHHLLPGSRSGFHFSPPQLLIAAGCFVVLWFLYDEAQKRRAGTVIIEEQTQSGDQKILPVPMVEADALILFLSYSKVSGSDLIKMLPNDADFGDPDSFAPLKQVFGWYMGLRAIAAHVSLRPLRVVIIPSPETAALVEDFRKVADRLCGPKQWQVTISVVPGQESGVVYEDLVALSDAINQAKHWLREHGALNNIIIDITSGKATCSAVAAGLSFARKERIQYVSTETHKPTLYNIYYDSESNPLGH